MKGLAAKCGEIIKQLNCKIFRHENLKWRRLLAPAHTLPARAGPRRDGAPCNDEHFSNYANSRDGFKLWQWNLWRIFGAEREVGIKAETTSKPEIRLGGVFRAVKLITTAAFRREGNSNIRTPGCTKHGKWRLLNDTYNPTLFNIHSLIIFDL